MAWLLEGDVSIRYTTCRDLTGADEAALSRLQERIATEGYGAAFLSRRNANGHWGLHYYQPKWTCTHYTLLDLKNLCAPQTLEPCREMVTRMFDECTLADGGLNLAKHEHPSDECVNGMILNYASYFNKEEPRLAPLVDHLLATQKADGGFTWNRDSGTGDPHTTVCVLEGFAQFQIAGARHRARDIEEAKGRAAEYLLSNGLFIDDADRRFRQLSYPYRYRYDLLRALEYFAGPGVPFDPRLRPARTWLKGKRQGDGLWHLENVHKGNAHFAMEAPRAPSRIITEKALHILGRLDRADVSPQSA